MFTYLIDENMPFLAMWNKEDFVHVSDLPFIHFDTDIWSYAFENQLTIITTDSDFYYRYLSSRNFPKVIWINRQYKKRDFNWVN